MCSSRALCIGCGTALDLFTHNEAMPTLHVNYAVIKILQHFILRLIVKNKIVQNKTDIVTKLGLLIIRCIILLPMSLKNQNLNVAYLLRSV